MALTLGDNFSYQGAKPLDARLKYDTLAAMKSVADATMYDGCMAYCSATDKTYQWKSTNTVDADTGKWREFSSGGGGGTTYTAGDGISIDNDEISIDPMPSEDMSEIIDSLPTGGNIAVAGCIPLGTLIPHYGETAPDFFLACDGTAYNKADYPELAKHLLSLTNNTPYIVDGDNTKFKVPDLRGEFIRGTGTNSHANQGKGASVGVHQDATQHVRLGGGSSNNLYMYPNNVTWLNETNADSTSAKGTNTIRKATLSNDSSQENATYYMSRPTNTSVLFCIAYKDIYSNPMNNYSTDEKIVGTWIDGKPLYQKTIVDTMPTIASSGTRASKVITLSSDIDFVCNMYGVLNRSNGTIVPIGEYYNQETGNVPSFAMMTSGLVDNTRTLFVASSTVSDSERPIYVTIQYTKTTD